MPMPFVCDVIEMFESDLSRIVALAVTSAHRMFAVPAGPVAPVGPFGP